MSVNMQFSFDLIIYKADVIDVNEYNSKLYVREEAIGKNAKK